MNYIQVPGNEIVKSGDTCVIHVSDTQRYIFKVVPNGEIQTKFGQIKSEDLLNHKYGVKFQCKRGWVLPLRLTPELWTQLLPHRTQILYQADISMILLQLDIKPGSIIVESGTGSGSLSHALIRACRPNGFLYTFEVNEFRAKEVQNEFVEHGYGDLVRVTNRNVCDLGFGDDLIDKADACLLDLPQTWSAIEHAHKILKPHGSRLCTFSPCVEQVKQNVAKMIELKMKDIVTLETLLQPYEIKAHDLRLWDESTLDGLTAIDKKRFENLEGTLESNRRSTGDSKSKNCEESTNLEAGNKNESSDCGIDDRILTDTKVSLHSQNESSDCGDNDSKALQRALTDPKAPFQSHMLPKKSYAYAKHYNESVSHSGYLTFATKRP
uniref:tRNA (adenine(58)-N(1))-methyltransferase catalytic subunit TRMT61A n=1 Tax=Aceria tosichella TaxID=561515 RepID=A0A6G1SF22_9ACAR